MSLPEVSSLPSLHTETHVISETCNLKPLLTFPGRVSCFLFLLPQGYVLGTVTSFISPQSHCESVCPTHCRLEVSTITPTWVYFQCGSPLCTRLVLRFSTCWCLSYSFPVTSFCGVSADQLSWHLSHCLRSMSCFPWLAVDKGGRLGVKP